MASIELIKGSDGSGNANVATVQNTRSSGASTIIVDTVLGINPDGFSGSMGTPHTFTDPITSEVITVISEATAVDFIGHVDGSNLEIDDIAPGYVDNGSEVGDIVIIRPTTQYADNVAEVLEVAHDDDGTLKAGAVDAAAVLASDVVTTAKILNLNVTTAKIADDAVTDQKLVNGKVYRRQGGSGTDWDTVGTTTYDTSASDIKIQSGTIFNNASPKTITFPVAFTNKPLVMVAVSSVNAASCFAIPVTITASNFTCQVYDNAGATNNAQNINWIAIGI